MNIGFIATEIGHQEGGAFMGGTVNNIVEVSRSLADRGHDITIITVKPRDAAENYAEPITWAEVHSLESRFSHGTPGYLLSFTKYAVSKVNALQKQNQLDVVSVHSGFSVWGLITSLSSQLGCPSVHVMYCPIKQASGDRVYDILQSGTMSKLWFIGSDKLIGTTDNVARSLDSAHKKKVEVIHNAIDTSKYTPSAADQFDLFETDDPIIGYLGSLNPQKGLDILVDAFQSLSNDTDVKLALGLEVRSEHSSSALWKRIENDPNIYPYGIIDNVPAFLARSDLFAVPFRTTVGPADYPVAVLEAMSCGTPPVSTRAGGLSDLITDNKTGRIVDEPDPELFRQALDQLLQDDKKIKALGNNARQMIQEGFSITSVTEKYENMFVDMVNK